MVNRRGKLFLAGWLLAISLMMLWPSKWAQAEYTCLIFTEPTEQPNEVILGYVARRNDTWYGPLIFPHQEKRICPPDLEGTWEMVTIARQIEPYAILISDPSRSITLERQLRITAPPEIADAE